MKKAYLNKYLIALISSLTVGTGIILACAGDWDDGTGGSTFTPSVFADTAYTPFFYSLDFYNGISHDTEHDTRFNQANINDWSSYLGKDIPAKEVETLLLSTAATAIDSANRYIAGNNAALPASLQPLQLFKKSNKKAGAFINYLSLAKASEDFAVNNFEYSWDYDSKKDKKPTVNTAKLNAQLLKEFTASKDAFIKQRYWFQLVRSYFFNEPAQKAVDFFESNEKAFPKNDMYYRSMAYAAGAYRKLNNYSKANYYYSKVYDGCNALKTVAHYSFHPQDENDWKATLALCANNDEKATLWQMLGVFYSDEKRSMQEIYTLNPRSEKLNLLLTRAINKEELRFSGSDGYSNYGLTIKKDTIDHQLYSFVNQLAQAGNTSQPHMWYIAAGYLDMLTGNTAKASASYKLAEKKLPKDEAAQSQLRLLKLINTIASVPNADSKLEQTILPDLDWLVNKAPQIRTSAALTWIKGTLSDRYQKQHELIKAVCFNNNGDFYKDDKNIEALESFLNKPNKTPFELLYAKLYPLKANDLYEYQAIRLTYANKLDEAIAKMEQSAVTNVLPGNPFNGRLQDCHDCDHAAAQKIKYTKLSLLKKMKDMEDKLKTGTDAYTNAMLLANAFYNITWYGNARAFYECNVEDSYTHYGNSYTNAPSNMDLATKYYTMGLNAAKSDEQKAKCHFMLAKCERNKYYDEKIFHNKDYQDGDHPGQPDFLAWNGFVSLKQYANTQFYKEAIRECGYFKTYTRK